MIVSNTSPLMNLAIIGQLNLLRKIFPRVVVPEEVQRELTIDGRGKPGADEIMRADWIETRSVRNTPLLRSLSKDLDIGESAAIALAVETKAKMILLDETDARNIAEIYNLRKTGVIGILMRAKNRHLIKEVRPFLDTLRTEANFWISQTFYDSVLLKMGEL